VEQNRLMQRRQGQAQQPPVLRAVRPPLYRQHDSDTGDERKHGRSADTRDEAILYSSAEVGRSHSSEETSVMDG